MSLLRNQKLVSIASSQVQCSSLNKCKVFLAFIRYTKEKRKKETE